MNVCTPRAPFIRCPTGLARRSRSWLVAALAAGSVGATAHAHGGVSTYPGTPVFTSTSPVIGGGSPSLPGQIVIDSRDGEWDLLQYGGSLVGGSLGAEGNATRSYVDFPSAPDSPSNYRSSASLFADVMYLGSTYQAARLTVSAENEPFTLSVTGAAPKTGYEPSTSLRLALAGNTVFDESIAVTTFAWGWAINLGPYDTQKLTFSYDLWLAELIVSSRAGASAQASLLATADLASVSFGLEGDASASCFGTASVSLSVLLGLAKAKLTGALDYGGPSIELDAGAGVFTGAGGYLEVCSRPISLVLDLYGEMRWRKRSISRTWHLVNWTRPESCETFLF